LRDVHVPDPFDLAVFCAEIARWRGRPLFLHEIPGPGAGSPCGVWFATDSGDHIFHAAGTTALHRQHIVLHEIAHLLCDHTAGNVGFAELAAMLLPDIDPATVTSVLARTSYEGRQEQLAEMMASLIVGRSDRPGRATQPLPALANLADLFGMSDVVDRG
jgi:hypothetical protein